MGRNRFQEPIQKGYHDLTNLKKCCCFFCLCLNSDLLHKLQLYDKHSDKMDKNLYIDQEISYNLVATQFLPAVNYNLSFST